SSAEMDAHNENSTSAEGATCTLLLHGPVELKQGWKRQKRHLFLFSDLLVMSNTNYKKNFKIKNKIPLSTLWTANCMDKVEDASIGAERSFILGWPTVNFVATFSSSELKEKWHSFLQRYINLAKEKDQPKSIPLKIFTEDIKNCAGGSEKDYQLWISSGKGKAPHPLIGHEHPYGIKMSHLPSTLLLPQGPEPSIYPSTYWEPLLPNEGFPEMQVQFILKPRHPVQNQQGRGQKTVKRSSFLNWAFRRGSRKFQDSQCTASSSAKPGQLFRVSLKDMCDNDNLPYPILDFLRNIQGSIFSSDLYDKWLGVTDQGSEEEKVTAAQ
ncbi:RHG20 protein, partial [Crocuta crocuta]